MSDRRWRNTTWHVAETSGDLYNTVKGGAYLAVLQDIRDAALETNRLLREQTTILRRLDRRARVLATLPPGPSAS